MSGISRRDWVLFFAFLSTSVFFRFFKLENIPALCGDEAWSAAQAQLAYLGLPHTWTVTSGRFLSPFYIALTYLTQAVEPFAIRYPAFVMGCLPVLLAFPALKTCINKEAAFLSTILIAVLPIHIEFSRLAWDLCFMPLFGLGFTVSILRKKWIWSLFFVVCGVLVHPTFIMLLSVVVIVYLTEMKIQGKFPSVKWLIAMFVVLVALAFWAFTWLPPSFPIFIPSLFSFWIFVTGIGGIFMGPVIFAHLSGFVPTSLALTMNIGFLLLLLVFLIFYVKKLTLTQKAFIAGLGGSLIALYFGGGPSAVSPGLERGSLFYCIPLSVVLGLLFSEVRYGKWISYAFGTLLLFLTFQFFFQRTMKDGGMTAVTHEFHTGPKDPKYAALEWIISDATKPGVYRFLVEDFTIYWNSLNYLLAHLPGPHIIRHTASLGTLNPAQRLTSSTEIIKFVANGGYAIGYLNSRQDKLFQELSAEGYSLIRKGFKDYGDKEFIVVWKLQ